VLAVGRPAPVGEMSSFSGPGVAPSVSLRKPKSSRPQLCQNLLASDTDIHERLPPIRSHFSHTVRSEGCRRFGAAKGLNHPIEQIREPRVIERRKCDSRDSSQERPSLRSAQEETYITPQRGH